MAARGAKEPDPSTQVRALSSSVSGGSPLARGYVLRGEERYFREAAIRVLVEAARQRGFEVSRHDAQDPDFDVRRVADDLAAAPLFAGARLVLLRSASSLLKKEGREPSALERALLAFLQGTSPSGSIVVEADLLRADHSLVKAVLARGGSAINARRLWDTPPPWNPDPRGAEVVQWLLARARERKLSLDAADAVYVVQATGNDLSALESALDRVAERRSQGVRDVVPWTGSTSPFQLAEDLCRGDVPRAVSAIESLFRAGFEARDGSREIDRNALLAMLLGSLRAKLRQTLCGARARERGIDLDRAAESAGVASSPRAREEFRSRLTLRRADQWRGMIDELADIERRSRIGGTLDESDLAAFALRWRIAAPPRAPQPADARGGFAAPRR
jgi:DNA polymerase III delta subunit